MKIRTRAARTYLGTVMHLRKFFIHLFTLVVACGIGVLGLIMSLMGLVFMIPIDETYKIVLMVVVGFLLSLGSLIAGRYLLSENSWSRMLGAESCLNKILGPGHELE